MSAHSKKHAKLEIASQPASKQPLVPPGQRPVASSSNSGSHQLAGLRYAALAWGSPLATSPLF